MKRTLIASCLVGAALFFTGCANNPESPGKSGPATSGAPASPGKMGVPSSAAPGGPPPSGAPGGPPPSGGPRPASGAPVPSGAPGGPPPSGGPVPTGAPGAPPPSGGPVPGGPPPSGAPAGPPPSGAPAGPPPSGAPAKVDTTIESRPKNLAETGAQDPAGILRIYVLDDGSIKPATLTATAGKPLTLMVNNYGKAEAAVQVAGEGAPKPATAGANEKTMLSFTPQAGDYTVTVGGKSAKLTVK